MTIEGRELELIEMGDERLGLTLWGQLLGSEVFERFCPGGSI
ncbi:MAG: hypothetical protein WBW48_10535 [Anaerolineae bacterium]